MKVDKKKIKELASTGLSDGKTKSQIFEEITSTYSDYRLHREIADIIQYIPDRSRVKKYGIYNTLMLILLLSLDVASAIMIGLWAVVLPCILTSITAFRKTRYYSWFILVGAIMLISVTAMCIMGYSDTESSALLTILAIISLGLVFIVFGIYLPRYLTPDYSVLEEEINIDGRKVKRKRIVFTIILIGLVMTTCTSKKTGNAVMSELDSLLAEEFNAGEPGGSVLIKKHDKIVFLKNYGLADLETKEEITENTLFNLGSVSKTFVSNGILILKENGILSLDDSIGKYFNDFNNKDIAGKVKIKHLLSHTSGLPDNRKVSENIDFFITAKDEENFCPVKQADTLNFEPGEKYEYSNPAFNGLALIIGKLTGEPWQKFIGDSIFRPSGMLNSRITDGPYPQDGVAHAYEKADGQFFESDYGEFPTFAAAGNGGVWSSVIELAKYENAIRNNLFLGKELTDESRTVFIPEGWSDTTKPFIGYSWFIGEEWLLGGSTDFNIRFIYHTGDQGGFRAFYIVIPEKDIIYIGLFNRPPESLDNIIKTGISVMAKNNWLD